MKINSELTPDDVDQMIVAAVNQAEDAMAQKGVELDHGDMLVLAEHVIQFMRDSVLPAMSKLGRMRVEMAWQRAK